MHNVNILYLIIDVPTLRQVMQITRVTRLYTASRREDGRRRRRRPVTSSAEAVSLCGLIALFGDDGCIFMPGSSAPWARREILKREGTKYSSSRRRYYYTLLAVKKKKKRGQWQACSYVSMRGLCSAVPSRAWIIRTSSGKSGHTRLCFGANCIVCVSSSLSFHSFHARVSIRRFYL